MSRFSLDFVRFSFSKKALFELAVDLSDSAKILKVWKQVFLKSKKVLDWIGSIKLSFIYTSDSYTLVKRGVIKNHIRSGFTQIKTNMKDGLDLFNIEKILLPIVTHRDRITAAAVMKNFKIKTCITVVCKWQKFCWAMQILWKNNF